MKSCVFIFLLLLAGQSYSFIGEAKIRENIEDLIYEYQVINFPLSKQQKTEIDQLQKLKIIKYRPSKINIDPEYERELEIQYSYPEYKLSKLKIKICKFKLDKVELKKKGQNYKEIKLIYSGEKTLLNSKLNSKNSCEGKTIFNKVIYKNGEIDDILSL